MKSAMLWVIILTVAVVTSAIAVVEVKHQARRLFVDLEAQYDERDRLNTEWSRLRLEQGALATHSRVERLARETLQMRQPTSETTQLIEIDASGASQ
ncbi:MAG: cell division protein FtsL [Spiribacter sp.]|jgi:cell division protein FtsL|nr:cell division protein FtsL [Spiribacter sp.]MDR9489469.1 cell division protein FtsL [Spiribacter sp.]